MHYYKFNIADWNLSTAHLSPVEEAIYFRLINHYYDTESPIPMETQSVFRRLRLGSYDEQALAILGEFFELTDKGWIHSRCEKVLKEYRKTAKKNKANGAKGGRPKSGAAYRETQNKPTGLPDQSQNNPNQEPLTKNHKPLTTISNGRFAPPQLQDVIDYMLERGESPFPAKSEAERFVNFYQSKGWVVGKAKMKDWKASVRNWLKPKAGGSNGQTGYNSNRKESLAERSHRETQAAFAKLEEEEASLSSVGANEPTIRPQVGQPGGAAHNGERELFSGVSVVVQENGESDR